MDGLDETKNLCIHKDNYSDNCITYDQGVCKICDVGNYLNATKKCNKNPDNCKTFVIDALNPYCSECSTNNMAWDFEKEVCACKENFKLETHKSFTSEPKFCYGVIGDIRYCTVLNKSDPTKCMTC